MNFSDALQAIKDGRHVTRTGWGGMKIPVYLVQRRDFQDIEVRNSSGGTPYVAVPADLLAEDWEILE